MYQTNNIAKKYKPNKILSYLTKLMLSLLVMLFPIINVFPLLMGNGLVSLAIMGIVFLTFAFSEAWNSFLNSKLSITIILSLLILVYSVCTSISGINYSLMIRGFLICILALFIGFAVAKNHIDIIFPVLRVFCTVISISGVYYLIAYRNIGAYDFALKNNYSPLLLFSVIILYICRDSIFNLKFITYLMIFLQLIVIFSTNCRSVAITTLIFIAVFSVVSFYKIFKNQFTVASLIYFVIFVVLIIVFSEKISDLVYSGLRLEILEESGTVKYSANRLPMIERGINLWLRDYSTFFFGATSGGYVECFYIDTLAFRGSIGLFLYLLFFINIIRKIFIIITKLHYLKLTGLLVLLASLVIALFEAGAPFIQGTTYFIVWFLVGISLATGYYKGEN